jgi:hypothetical protein
VSNGRDAYASSFDSLRPTFALITVILVRDALRVSEAEATSYYDLFARETAPFKTPLWSFRQPRKLRHRAFALEGE